jgi:hypothetical protein
MSGVLKFNAPPRRTGSPQRRCFPSSQSTPRPSVDSAILRDPKHAVNPPLVGLPRIVGGVAGGGSPNGVPSGRGAPGSLGRRRSRRSVRTGGCPHHYPSASTIIENLIGWPPTCHKVVKVLSLPTRHHLVHPCSAAGKGDDNQKNCCNSGNPFHDRNHAAHVKSLRVMEI